MIFLKSLFLIAPLALLSCSMKEKEVPRLEPLASEVQVTNYGLKNQILRAGQGGPTPNAGSSVTVHYRGMFPDGCVFKSSYEDLGLSGFVLSDVKRGFVEGLKRMTRGEIRRFWIPARLAYGEHADGLIPAGDLVLDIELVDFKK